MTPSLLQSDILTGLRAYLLAVLPSETEVVRGDQNRVAMPSTANFVVMTAIRMTKLSTSIDTWDQAAIPPSWPTQISAEIPTEVTVQIDCYGPSSLDNATVIGATFRDFYGYDAFDPNRTSAIVPMYCEDAMQLQFTNGEDQYEQRWMIMAHVQYNPIISTPMQFFNTVTISAKEIV